MGFEYLGHNLRFFRQRSALSQAALATRAGAGFTQTYISRLECGQRPMADTHVDALAKVLEVSREQLLRRPRVIKTKRAVVVSVVPEARA